VYWLLRQQGNLGFWQDLGVGCTRRKGTAEELEERRRKFVELLDYGKTAKEIACILGVSRVSIQR
jgi:hypothetical protein